MAAVQAMAAVISDTDAVREARVKQYPRRKAEDEAEVVNNSTAAR